MKGIYKITSPSGKVYIGQSININKRWKQYLNGYHKTQAKLNSSFLSHGVEKHTFEVVHECEVEDLNRLERYYQELYDVLGDKGLNLMLQEADELPRIMSEETKRKISEAQKGENHYNWGKKLNPLIVEKISKSNKGKTHSEYSKQKISKAKKGTKMSEETRLKMSKSHKGKVFSEETREKLRKANLGKKMSEDAKKKMSENGSKKIRATDINGVVYEDKVNELLKRINIGWSTVQKKIKGGYSKKWKDWTFEYI